RHYSMQCFFADSTTDSARQVQPGGQEARAYRGAKGLFDFLGLPTFATVRQLSLQSLLHMLRGSPRLLLLQIVEDREKLVRLLLSSQALQQSGEVVVGGSELSIQLDGPPQLFLRRFILVETHQVHPQLV